MHRFGTPHRFGRRALIAALVVVSALMALTGVALAAGVWSAPEQVDTTGARPATSSLLSCPSTTLCIGASTATQGPVSYQLPAGGPPHAVVGTLQSTYSDAGLESLDCPTATLCVGTASYSGGSSQYTDVVTSTDPAAVGSWVEQNLTTSPTQVSCPTATLCVGPTAGLFQDGDGDGAYAQGLVLSQDPTGGPTAWTQIDIDAQFADVDCPTANFCLALDDSGNVWTSTDPTGGASAWIKSAAATPLAALANQASGGTDIAGAISCSGPDLCIAAGPATGTVLVSTDPAGSAAWTSVAATPGLVGAVYCLAGASLCLAGDASGNIATSSTPASTGSWTSVPTADTKGIGTLTCTSADCYATGGYANQTQALLQAATPTAGGAWNWQALATDTYNSLSSVSCVPSGGSCIAVDGSRYFESANPARGSSSWTSQTETKMYKDKSGDTSAVSCLSRTLCLALISDQGPATVGSDSDLFTFNPVGGPHDFFNTRLEDGGTSGDISASLDGLACAQGTCIAQLDGYAQTTIQSSHPANPNSWKTIRHANARYDLTCLHGNRSCVAIASPPFPNQGGPDLLVAPRRGGPWTKQAVDPNGQIMDLACPSAGACIIVDAEGNMLVSTAPLSGPSSWKLSDQDPAGFNAVSCQTATRCVAVDADGAVVVGRP